ncbi:dehydrogenase [Lithospermum erythrorhizon]|uniref:Dehydrogenase n=1 Tax=Lithospermum erythrorhizon TaxID=34254 RepID=A0AAV3RD39_LITER
MNMTEAEQKGFFNGFKQFWCDRFAFVENYTRFIKNRDHPLPSWSSADVEEFIASDPVHGPILKTARQAVAMSAVGSAIGAFSLAGIALKYSKTPHGTALALGAGAAFGWTFGHEIANQSLQLYILDTLSANVKFMEWWQKKSEGQS